MIPSNVMNVAIVIVPMDALLACVLYVTHYDGHRV
jgi:hypothetical protein